MLSPKGDRGATERWSGKNTHGGHGMDRILYRDMAYSAETHFALYEFLCATPTYLSGQGSG